MKDKQSQRELPLLYRSSSVGIQGPGRTHAQHSRRWYSKAEIAAHFQIGIRTVTKLMRQRVLPYSKLRNIVRFDVDRCDQAFRYFETPGLIKGGTDIGTRAALCWHTKRQVAAHFRISERTVTTLMRKRSLPFVKFGRLVRLDLVECDGVMQKLEIKSILTHCLKSSPKTFSA